MQSIRGWAHTHKCCLQLSVHTSPYQCHSSSQAPDFRGGYFDSWLISRDNWFVVAKYTDLDISVYSMALLPLCTWRYSCLWDVLACAAARASHMLPQTPACIQFPIFDDNYEVVTGTLREMSHVHVQIQWMCRWCTSVCIVHKYTSHTFTFTSYIHPHHHIHLHIHVYIITCNNSLLHTHAQTHWCIATSTYDDMVLVSL